MNKNDLEFIINDGENQFVEFKEKFDKRIDKEIIAFANGNGGRIFIGIDDKRNVTGINITNSLRSKIQNIAHNCDTKINVKIETYKNILIVNVKEGDNKPYSCQRGFYLRIGPNSQKLSRDEIINFSITEGQIYFDEQINEEFIYPDDFDHDKFNFYIDESKLTKNISDGQILVNLGVAKKEKNKLLFNNAGILFFAKKPNKFYLTSKVVCVEFATNRKDKVLDRKIFDDGILSNIKNSINFIQKRIKTEFVIKTAERVEIPQFPIEAYREAVVNAIMHRDYFDKSSDVFIENYRNKIVVFNPGGLVKWLKPEEFGKVSKTRNPVIASLLSRTIFVEKLGTGIERIRRAMRDEKLPLPKFDYYEHSFYVNLFDRKLDNVKDTNVDTNVNTKPINRQKWILNHLKTKGNIKSKLIQNHYKISKEIISRDLKSLIKQNKIIKKGGGSNVWYELKNEKII